MKSRAAIVAELRGRAQHMTGSSELREAIVQRVADVLYRNQHECCEFCSEKGHCPHHA